jgi:hypothetical protein
MEIHSPLCITSRLLPGVKIGEGTISIEYAGEKDGRHAYRWFIDNGNVRGQDFQGDDLCSGIDGGSLQEGLASLLGFLGAFAEAITYQDLAEQKSDLADLFPAGLAEWAADNADEIGMLAFDLEERPGEFIIE